VAAVEFAVVLPLLASFLVPMADLGYRAYVDMQVQTAVQAGAHYALLHGWQSTQIQTAITNATTWSSISASPAPAKSCGCASGTSVAAAGCSDTCANGQPAGTYVTVSAQSPFQPIFPFPTVGVAGTISAQAMVRIR
jgi:Flp pilus assembly protein TadG